MTAKYNYCIPWYPSATKVECRSITPRSLFAKGILTHVTSRKYTYFHNDVDCHSTCRCSVLTPGHGAHKLDLSTLFTTFFLWTSPPFILSDLLFENVILINTIILISQISGALEMNVNYLKGITKGHYITLHP